jgi:hypothetical protein
MVDDWTVNKFSSLQKLAVHLSRDIKISVSDMLDACIRQVVRALALQWKLSYTAAWSS